MVISSSGAGERSFIFIFDLIIPHLTNRNPFLSGTDSTYPFAERELTYTLEPGFISSGFREGAVLGEEDITDKEGNYTGKKKLRDSSAGLKALESLCKYLGFSSAEKEESEYKEAKIITISNLDDEKI